MVQDVVLSLDKNKEYGMEACYYPDWCYCVKVYLTHIYHSKICSRMHLYAYMGKHCKY